jgi:tRNA(Arg) A34 adenosine deaminase TadA
MAASKKPPVLDLGTPLAKFWNRPVSKLVTLPPDPISPQNAERHRLYSLLLMAILYNYWNGNKHGQTGDYPWREKQKLPNGIYAGGRYLGHNIAAIAVDGNGEVIDFDFNHNNLFSSSVEHAESRLVRRIFSLTQLNDEWHVRLPSEPPLGAAPATLLNNVTLYTSLESCAQCSGIMNLAEVNSIIFLQRDYTQFSIGNILRNLTMPGLRAPLPIPGDHIGLEYFGELDRSFRQFVKQVPKKPFYTDGTPESVDKDPSITSYLCTDEAMDIFGKGAKEFQAVKVKYASYRPLDEGKKNNQVLTNGEVLKHVRDFFAYASVSGQRGTPHKL